MRDMAERVGKLAQDGRGERALVGWNLRRLRVARGLSQERLALEAGVDRAYVSGLERARENPTVDVLDRLAATLDAPLAAFFAQPPDAAQPPASLKAGRKARKGGYGSPGCEEPGRAFVFA
jgi:transcriptional regulator with XRE-family HTH domain